MAKGPFEGGDFYGNSKFGKNGVNVNLNLSKFYRCHSVYIRKRTSHGGLKIWILFSRGKNNIVLPLENKIHIFASQCNILYLYYRYWWNTRIFPFTKKSYLHRAQWRYYFYLSRVRILVPPWLLTWLANYKRAFRSGARPVLLKFHSQNGFEVRRR